MNKFANAEALYSFRGLGSMTVRGDKIYDEREVYLTLELGDAMLLKIYDHDSSIYFYDNSVVVSGWRPMTDDEKAKADQIRKEMIELQENTKIRMEQEERATWERLNAKYGTH